MNDLDIWLVYAGITATLALLAFGIPEKSKGLLKAVQSVSSFLVVIVGITFAVVTVVLVLDRVAPNWGGGGNSNDQEQCVPDPWGSC